MFRSELSFSNILLRALKLSVPAFTFLVSSCSSIYYQPDQNLYSKLTQFESAGSANEVRFTSIDGKTKLVGWHLVPKTKPKGMIIQFHGNAENMSSHVHFLQWLLKDGYEIFAFDYRGYGASEGSPDPNSVIDDGIAALDYADQHRKSETFIVWGQSIGGSIAPRSIQKFKNQNKIDLLILDSTFVSYKTTARQMFSKNWFTWPFQWFAWLIASDTGNSSNALQSYRGQSLVIHDRRDPVIDIDLGRETYRLLKGKKEIWEFDEGSHLGLFGDQYPERQKRLVQFLDQIK